MSFDISVTVRCCETDALGHVNNTSYFIYLEEARIKFFQYLGSSMDVNGWHFILASTKCDYVAQGYFNDTLMVKTNVSRVGTKSFQLVHEILNEYTGVFIARGEATIVYFDFDSQKSEPIPDWLRLKLSQHVVEV